MHNLRQGMCARNIMVYYMDDFIIARKVSGTISLLVCVEISYKNISKYLTFASQAAGNVLCLHMSASV
jgi:hypothetical protein